MGAHPKPIRKKLAVKVVTNLTYDDAIELDHLAERLQVGRQILVRQFLLAGLEAMRAEEDTR